jgi:putative endonuclease
LNNKQKGFTGENYTAAYLEKRGYRILTRNFRGSSGEIDIIASKDKRIIFIEVKTWDYYDEESLEKSINSLKKHRIIQTAKYFLNNNPKFNEYLIQFDIILYKRALNKIVHLKEAFWN